MRYLILVCVLLSACQQPRVAESDKAVITSAESSQAKPVENKSAELYRINCGDSKPYTDPAGTVWAAEQEYSEGSWGYVGGDSVWRGREEVAKTLADTVYNNEHYEMEAWRFTLDNGDYTVQLHFAETYDKAFQLGSRTFSVSLEDTTVLEEFDIYKEAGAEFTAIIKEFPISVKDGVLDIEFTALQGNALINGIVIKQR